MQILRIWDGEIGDQGARYLSIFITETRNASLSVLELLNCGIGTLGCVMISRMFEPSLPTKISILTLDYNNFGNEGLSELMNYLRFNKTIKYLSLAYCGIDERGIINFDNYINKTTCLETLILQGNPLKNSGVKQLISLLTANESIEEINLNNVLFGNGPEKSDVISKENFDPDGVIDDLSKLMQNREQLVVYNLKYNFITDRDFEFLLTTLKQCKHICIFSVDEKIKRDLFDELLKLLKGKKRGGKKNKKAKGK